MCQIHCQPLFFHIALASFIVNWVMHFYHFPRVTIVRLIIFIIAGCLETISNAAYNIPDPLMTNTPEKKILLATKV